MTKRDKKQRRQQWHHKQQELSEKRFEKFLDHFLAPDDAAQCGASSSEPEVAKPAPVRTELPPAENRPTPVSDADEVYTIAEVCKLLKLSRATVDRMHERGELPGRFKLGNQVRYHGPTLRAFLAASVMGVDNG